MVVTFMLVIMSAAIVTLSKRVIGEMRELQASEAKAGANKSNEKNIGGAQGAVADDSNAILSPREAADGQSIAERGAILRQKELVDGDARLTVRTRKVDESERIRVAAMDAAQDTTGVEVQSADVLLTIDFDEGAVRYPKEAEDQVVAFSSRLASGSEKIEIWSVAPQRASISEAERMAFYRAVLTRNLLIKAGIAPGRISTQARVIDPSEGQDQVRVVLKP